MAALSSDYSSLQSVPYLQALLDSSPPLRGRRVVVLDAKTANPIPAEIVASRIDPLVVSYVLRDPSTKESYGIMSLLAQPKSCVYVSTVKNLKIGSLKGVGSALLDQAFLLGESHGARRGSVGLRVASCQQGNEPDPAPFYLKYGFLPTDDDYPKYPDISLITKDLKKLDREHPEFDQNPSVKRAKAILAKELGQESVSNEELFEKWYWRRNSQPTIKLSEKILDFARRGKSIRMIIDMHLSDAAIARIRRRIFSK